MEASMLLGKAWLLYIDTNLETEEMGDNKTEQDSAVILSAYTNDELCAVCVITELQGSASLCIPFLRVIPEYRGLGLGKELLQRAPLRILLLSWNGRDSANKASSIYIKEDFQPLNDLREGQK